MPTTQLTPEAEALQARALVIQYLVTEALCELDGLPSHPQRTRLGRRLLEARSIAGAWQEDGDMDSSTGVHS